MAWLHPLPVIWNIVASAPLLGAASQTRHLDPFGWPLMSLVTCNSKTSDQKMNDQNIDVIHTNAC